MAKKLSPTLRVLKDVAKRTKGWPCGVPADGRVAPALVAKGYLRWAPPIWNYPNNPKTYGLTTLGKLIVDGRVRL